MGNFFKRPSFFLILSILSISVGIFAFLGYQRASIKSKSNTGCLQLVEDYTNLVKELAEFKAKAGSLEVDNKMLVEEMNRLEKQLKEVESAKEEVIKQLLVLKKECSRKEKEYHSLRERVQILEKEKKKLSQDNVALNNVVKKLERDLTQYKSRLEEYKKKVAKESELPEDIKELKSVLEEKRRKFFQGYTELQKRALTLEKENQRLTNLFKKTQEELAKLEKENKELNSSLKRQKVLLAEIETDRDFYKIEGEKSRIELKKCNQSLFQLQNKYSAVLRENQDLKAKIEVMPRKLMELSQLNKELLKEKARLHYNLGVFYTQKGEYKKAIKEFQEVLKIDPNDADTHYNLGVIYSEYEIDNEKAVDHFREYLGLAPQDIYADKVREYLVSQEVVKGDEAK